MDAHRGSLAGVASHALSKRPGGLEGSIENPETEGRRPVHPARQTDAADRKRFGPRLDVAFLLHPRQGHVDRPALEPPGGTFHQLKSEELLVRKQVENQPFER